MRPAHRFVGFALAAAIGFATPQVVPHDWLGYILGASLLLAIVSAGLAAASARGGDESSRGLRAMSWLIAGTSRPTAEVVDNQALRLFWMTLVFLGSFTVGAFVAVRP